MVSLFLLSQVFLIISHGPLVRTLAAVILKSNLDIIKNGTSKVLEVAFLPPTESLEKSLENLNETQNDSMKLENVEEENENEEVEDKKDAKNNNDLESNVVLVKEEESRDSSEKCESNEAGKSEEAQKNSVEKDDEGELKNETIEDIKHLSVTDEEKEQRLALENPLTNETKEILDQQEPLSEKPFLEAVLNSLHCSENDYAALFALCLLYALANNQVLFIYLLIFFVIINQLCILYL